jgi:hypothetical protein
MDGWRADKICEVMTIYFTFFQFTSLNKGMILAPAPSAKALSTILPQVPVSPYEAHQKARTFASRYVKSNQFDTAIEVLFQSARDLFSLEVALISPVFCWRYMRRKASQ